MNVPIGVIATVLSVTRLAETRGPETRLDLVAVLLVGGGSTAFVWGLIRAGQAGWGTFEVLVALSSGIALLLMFIAWEAHAPAPMLPPRLLQNRSFRAATSSGFLMFGSLFAAAFLVAQYFQIALGYLPRDAGLRMLPWTTMPVIISPLAGAVSDRIGRRPVLALGLLVHGVGISMAYPVAATAVVSAVDPVDMGKASGVSSTMARFGSAFGIAVAAAVFAANGHLGAASAFTEGFRPALATAAGLSVLGALTALAVGD